VVASLTAIPTKRRKRMQLTLKRGGLLLGLLAALIATMALTASSASAEAFCGNQKVNNKNKCWGAPRSMQTATAISYDTGICVGADLYNGECKPAGQVAYVGVPLNTHYPWVIGTGAGWGTVSELSFTA
jgi:hypothetical protein